MQEESKTNINTPSPGLVQQGTSATQSTYSASSNEPSIYSLKNDISYYLDREDLSEYPGAERTVYDFTYERNEMYNTNLIESSAHMLKGILGVGILSMHEAYMHCGVLTAILATAVLACVGYSNTLMLVNTAQWTYVKLRVPKMTYPDLMETAFATGPVFMRKCSKFARYFVDFFLFAELCATCNVYQIMMASTLKTTLELVSKHFFEINLSIRIYLLIVTVPLLPLCVIRNLKYLAPFSLLADLFILTCIAMALIYSLMYLNESISQRPSWKSVAGLFKFTGILLYTIECTTMALPIENNMRRPKYFPAVAWIAMTTVLILSTAVGFFGYWRWGDNCVSPIIMHMPKNTYYQQQKSMKTSQSYAGLSRLHHSRPQKPLTHK